MRLSLVKSRISKLGEGEREGVGKFLQNVLQLCDILLPSSQSSLSKPYREAIQRALRMPQCRLIPFFGAFLRDLYSIVNDVPNVVVASSEGENDKLEVGFCLYSVEPVMGFRILVGKVDQVCGNRLADFST